ncbi:MAG: hypothetical protein KBC12_02880 [Candidatus Pacebacteria bacterium]|nr:hypothetical protein [Candidatus Paceibacterota bacterium]MBP9851385.1 hypothetical protein [Candidatus Paceibacterota bacterium]
MKNLRLCALATLLLLGFTETHAQTNAMTPKQIFYRLIQPIVNDTDGIHPILYAGAFAVKNHDEHTYYEWDATSVGLELRGTFEHFENLFVYTELFYRVSEQENKYYTPSTFTRDQGVEVEFGAGMKFPVAIGDTGFFIEGELTSPFNFFNPALAANLKWENKSENLSVSFGNRIIARDASIWNPGFHFEYRILPRKHSKKK